MQSEIQKNSHKDSHSETKNGAPAQFARWFRDSTPYISAYRGKTFVVMMGGDAIAHDNCTNILHDLALLTVLGVRVVLVHGARPQIVRALNDQDVESSYHQHMRITDATALDVIKTVNADIRGKIEAAFSMGLPTTPLHKVEISVYSGNFVNARPIGVVGGVDLKLSGQVRSIRKQAIEQALGDNALVLISALGYSPAGETYNLSSEELAMELALALEAEKLILFSDQVFSQNRASRLHSAFTPEEAGLLMQHSPEQSELASNINLRLHTLISACEAGVPSSQLVSYQEDGALLQEIFTARGHGTQIRKRILDEVRAATPADIAGIIELIQPLEDAGVLIRRSRDRLEQEIEHFLVAEIDGVLAGCCALYPMQDDRAAELACLVAHPTYRNTSLEQGLGAELLHAVLVKAKALKLTKLFALTTRTRDWFIENGFTEVGMNDLPSAKQAMYNFQRNSKVLLLNINSEV